MCGIISLYTPSTRVNAAHAITPGIALFLDHAQALGGAERSLLLLLKHLDRGHWQPHLACCDGPLAKAAAALGVPVSVVPMPRLRRSPHFLRDWLAGARAIAHLAQQTGAALLVANTVRAAFYGALAARMVRLPFVWHMRDFWLSESRPRHLWADALGKRLLCATAARVITNSYAVAAHLPCCRKVTVVYNAIEIERFDPAMDGQPFRKQYGIPTDAPLIGTVGRLRPWKGQDRFLRVLARVREAVPGVWGMIVGGAIFGESNDYLKRLQALAVDLGFAGQVVFTGHLEDVRPALAAMDIFVHAGNPEPFGLVNLEAMAMGKPVVAFAHGALPEIIEDGQTGLLAPPEDESALAGAVITLLHNPARRATLGQAGRKRVAEHFTAHRVAKMMDTILQEII